MDRNEGKRTGPLGVPAPLGVAAALVIVGAGVQAIASWLAPLLVAVFLAMISTPPLLWLRRHHVPWGIGVVLLFLAVGLAFFQLFTVLEVTGQELAQQAPLYQERWQTLVSQSQQWLTERWAPWQTLVGEIPTPSLSVLAQGAQLLAATTGQVTAHFALVLIAFLFLLLEVPSLPLRFSAAFPHERRTAVRFRRFLQAVNRYLVIKTSVSILTGLAVWGWLTWHQIGFALFFAVLAGLLSYIPTIGSLLAALPAIGLALLEGGASTAAIVALGYGAINLVLGSWVEPRWMGQALGLSPTVVLVSLLLWGWLLGTVGAFLSIPLTMVAKLALESHPATRGWAVLLGAAASGQRRRPKRAGGTSG